MITIGIRLALTTALLWWCYADTRSLPILIFLVFNAVNSELVALVLRSHARAIAQQSKAGMSQA